MLLACSSSSSSSSSYLRKLPPRQVFSLVSSSYLNKTTTSIVRDDDPISKPPYNCLLITRRFLSASSSSSSSTTVIGKKVAGHSISPWLMLSAEMELSSWVFKFYSVAEDKVISIVRKNMKVQLGLKSKEKVKLECRGSSHGWLVLFDRCSSDLFLYNPLSNRHLKLPSIRKLEAIPEKDLKTGFSCVNKLIISSSDPEGDVNCRALMIHGRWNNLAYCCPNSSSSNEWFETYHRYEDVACCGDNNLFLGINDDKPSGSQWHYPEFEGWDLKDVSRPMLISLEDRLVKDFGKTFPWKGYGPKKYWMSRDANFLVAAADDMYYVCLNSGNWDLHKEGDYHFHVHKFDFGSGKLVHMDRSLDGLAFFVGRNHSFALSAVAEFPGQVLQPNSIYFTHQEDYQDYPFGTKHVKAYNYQDGTFETKNFYTLNNDKRYPKPPVWYTPTCAPAAALF